MKNKQTKHPLLTDDELVALLNSLKVEPSSEADFEGRFLHDFRNRLAQQALLRPARKLLWEHLLLKITNFGKLKWAACGATSLGVGVLAVGLLTWNSGDSKVSSVGKVEAHAPADFQDNSGEVNVKASATVETTRVITPAVLSDTEKKDEDKAQPQPALQEDTAASQSVSE